MSFINPEPGDEAAGMLASILALTDKLGVYPMESISEQLSPDSRWWQRRWRRCP